MASFRVDRIVDEHGHYSLPFALMQNGYVTTYWSREALDEDAAELRRIGFIVRMFDCASWDDDTAMHDELRIELGLPEYTGRNFDALDESLTDMNIPDESGLAIVLDNFDDRRRRDKVLLDVLAGSARHWLLFGRLQPVLIRVVEPTYGGPSDLGGTRAWRNRREVWPSSGDTVSWKASLRGAAQRIQRLATRQGR